MEVHDCACSHILHFRQVIARNLWLGQSLEDAINEKRLHHQLFPNVLVWEEGLNQVNKIVADTLLLEVYSFVMRKISPIFGT